MNLLHTPSDIIYGAATKLPWCIKFNVACAGIFAIQETLAPTDRTFSELATVPGFVSLSVLASAGIAQAIRQDRDTSQS